MKKRTFLLIGLLAFSFFTKAQDNFSFTPQKPRPGDIINISYTPPADVFDATDVINCVAYKWGVYCNEMPELRAKDYKPVEVLLKKKGNHYEGTVLTDTVTRMLAFSFTTSNVKWKMGAGLKLITAAGKADKTKDAGYCVLFFDREGNVCRKSHYFAGRYLVNESPESLGIKNPEKATVHFLKEQELFADAKYYTLASMVEYCPMADKDKFTAMAKKEMENLFATGLKSVKDIELMADLSMALRLYSQNGYFSKLATEKAGGNRKLLIDKYYELGAENDVAKRAVIIDQIGTLYNKQDCGSRNYSSPHYVRTNFLLWLAEQNKPADFITYADRYNFLKGAYNFGGPDDLFTAEFALDTLKRLAPVYAEKFILDRAAIYKNILSNISVLML